jgi:serine/threonine-protein kinase
MTADDREERWGDVLVACLEAFERGEAVDRRALLAEHPEFTEELAEFFAERDRIEALGAPLRVAAQAGAVATQADAGDDTADQVVRVTPEGEVPSFGDYEILDEIARGGMGVVYKVRQKSLDRVVALKMVRGGDLAPDEEQRFRHEARVVAGLDHPHIVPVYEVGEESGRLFFSMKLMEGGSLAAQPGRFAADPRAAARTLVRVARAVHYAHQRGILHRDLKPANILLDDSGTPYVTDFGLAKRMDTEDSLNPAGVLVGTLRYMAPEQLVQGRAALTTAADVYGLGTILYVLLTGRPPFAGDAMLQTLRQVQEQAPEPPNRLNPRVDRDLAMVCLKCLEKDPAGRYGTAEALADDLECWLAGEPVQAWPIGRTQRLWRWCRRKPVLACLLAALVMVFVIGLGAVMLEWQRAEREWVRAEQLTIKAQKERDAAEREARRADDNLDVALGFLHEHAIKVSNDNRLRKHDLEPLRQELLLSAVKYYEQFVAQNQFALQPGAGEKVRVDLGRAYGRLGLLVYDTKSAPEAVQLMRKAEDILADLVKEYPAKSDYQRGLAITCLNMGNMYRGLERFDDAERAYQRSREQWSKLARDHAGGIGFETQVADLDGSLANIYSDTQRPEMAEPAYQRALKVYRRLLGSRGDDPDLQDGLALLCNNFGVCCRQLGRPDLAETLYKEALDRRQARVLKDLDDHRLQTDQAMSHYNLANLYQGGRRWDEAESRYKQAITIQERVARTHPAVAEYRAALAASRTNLGCLYRATQRPALAEQLLREAITFWGDLANARPEVAGHALGLAESSCELGFLLTEEGDLPGSLDWYGRAIDTSEQLLKSRLAHSEAWQLLSKAYGGRARALTRLNRIAEALADWDRAIKAADSDRDGLRLGRAASLARAGKHTEAVAEAEALVAKIPKAPKARAILYAAACVYGQASAAVREDASLPVEQRDRRAEEYAASAYALLRQAHAAGYFNEPAAVAQLNEDANLAPLRSRADFKELLAALEGRAKPESK